jgi:hypothetical protein
MSDNKSQSNDHDMQSDDAVITESDDCDDSSEVFDDCRRNDTLPPVFANIVFDLTEPEGERRLREMLDAPKMKLVLWEFDQWLRNQLKYSESPDCCVEQLNIARKYFCLACDDHGIRLDEE